MDKKNKDVFSHTMNMDVPLKFLCFMMSHKYNKEMDDSDRDDQLKLVHWFERFQSNTKCW